ncbi:putative zinc finger protein [Orchesella cincta]|uniref:Putative zinc finger protein n=1 Tax=Orchesella cincta TaxID=48709 RepID=A0A1D2MLL3_ORCCI|nr:putative zinc finger protein [Orchesella cincta]
MDMYRVSFQQQDRDERWIKKLPFWLIKFEMSSLYSANRRRKVDCHTCCVCLNSLKSRGERQEIYEQIYARFVQVLKRYLQISIGGDGDNPPFADKFVGGGVVSVFCDGCLNTVTQVCDLYHELCTIRVRLGSKLGELGTLIEKDNNTKDVCDDRTKETHSRLINSVVGDQNEEVVDFRQLVASRCFQKFKDAGPLVLINPVAPTVTPSPFLERVAIVKVETETPSNDGLSMPTECEVNNDLTHHDLKLEPDMEDSGMDFPDETWDNLSNNDLDLERITEPKESSSIPKTDTGKRSRCRKIKTDWKGESGSVLHEGQNAKSRRRKKTSRMPEIDDEKSSDIPLLCCHCDQLFSSTSHLRTHLNEIEAKKEDKPLQCVFCWESFALEDSHQLHLKIKHPNKSFVCHESSCRASFKKLQQLNEHLLDHSSADELHLCSKCKWRFLSSAHLTLHVLTHTRKTKGVYNCLECDKVFSKIVGYQDHYNWKHGDSLPIHKCSKCELSFVSTHRLNRHLKSHEEKAKLDLDNNKIASVDAPDNPLRCNECNKTFVDESRLRFHSWYHSSKKCSVCEEKFIKFVDFSNHMKLAHNEEILETCHICRKTMKSRFSLIKHLRIMHGPQTKDHLCPYCGRGFRDNLYLSRHMACSHPEECHEGAKHSCPHCKQKFRLNLVLKRHLDLCDKNPDRKTVPEPPTIVKQICSGRENVCSTCGRVVKHGTVAMRRHLLTHVPKELRQKGSLWNHLRKIHDAKKTFCSVCGVLYFSSDGSHLCSQQQKRDKKGYHHFNKKCQLIEGVSQKVLESAHRTEKDFHIVRIV